MSTVTDIGIKAALFYGALIRLLVGFGILAVFWPDESLGFRRGLIRAVSDFGLWLGHWPWSKHPGKRAKRGKGRRGQRRKPAVTA